MRSVMGLELEACGVRLILVVPDEGFGSQVSERDEALVGLQPSEHLVADRYQQVWHSSALVR